MTLVVSERVTREYYSTPAEQRPPLLKLTNAFKAGLYYGLVLDGRRNQDVELADTYAWVLCEL